MRETIVILLIVVVCCVGAKSYEPKSVQRVEPDVLKFSRSCYIDELTFLGPVNCSGYTVEDDRTLVPHGNNCTFKDRGTLDLRDNQNTVTQLFCNDGHWSGTDVSIGFPSNRQKKWFMWLVVACVALCGGGGSVKEVTHYPPELPNPCKPNDVRDDYRVAAGGRATVSWTDIPKATDKNGDTPIVELYSGGTNGGQYSGNEYGQMHTITYRAKDSTGLKAYCSFSFIVTEATCSSPPWIDNGIRMCDDFRVGKQCQYNCQPGYEVIGNEQITCTIVQSPTWTSFPSCEKKICNPPNPPDNGQVVCPSYDYQALCTMECDTGYRLTGSMFTQCQSNGTWSSIENTTCEDARPPSLACKTPQIFYADRESASTSVTWEEPTVTDITDPSPTLNKTSGPDMGDIISGIDYVSYIAIDEDGNISPECVIELQVQEITCGHPSDTLISDYLMYDCSDTKYVYGVSCILSCFANLPLAGTDVITCEKDGDKTVGVWDWGNGTEPFCQEISCPELEPPINGAIVYDSILTRPVYTLKCNDKFDIPYLKDFQGTYYCLDNSGWQPTNIVPDCTNKNRGPDRLVLPGKLFYYEGECGTPDAMADIEQNFVGLVQSVVHPYFDGICPPIGETCTTLNNIVIRCGEIQKRDIHTYKTIDENQKRTSRLGGSVPGPDSQSRQRRQTDSGTLVIDIDIVVFVTIPEGDSIWSVIDYYDSIINDLSDTMQTMLMNGDLDLNNFTTYNDSWQAPEYADMACETGFKLDGVICKPCPLGQYLDDATDECTVCPVGAYSSGDGIIGCTPCPEGTSTKHNGSKSLDYCIGQCGPGTMSPDGMLPCASCLYGEYQDESGQSECKQCPSGTTTLITNAASVEDCHGYDILIEETSEPVYIASIPQTINSLTLMMWIHRVDGQVLTTTLQLGDNGVDRMILYLSDTIRVNIPNQVNEDIAPLNSATWVHLAVVWDTSDNRISVYINGYMTFSTSVSSNSPLISNGELTMSASGHSEMHLTGFHLFDKVLDVAEITTYSSSCHITTAEDIIDTGDFRKDNTNGISVAPSSICDSVDNCQPDPCNGHMCIDGQDTFSCYCYSGWSGATCLVPPDHCIDNECENGATCLNGNSSYTCECLPGYTGALCDIPPVDGEWSEWEVTSACTHACGGGTQTRARTCDNPPPGPYGTDCVGDDTETVTCNTAACHVCDDLPVKNGSQVSCITDITTGTRTCNVYCGDTQIMQPKQHDNLEYECGPNTNYEWGNVETLPSCVEPTGPSSLSITTSIEYTADIPHGVISAMSEMILANFESTSCASLCDIEITITGNVLTVTYSQTLAEGSDLHMDAYENTGAVSASLQELIDSIVSLETTAQYLQNNTADIFDVVVDGVSYTSHSDSLTTTGLVTCPNGHVARDGSCVRCPAGTYSNGIYCDYCERGTYQPTSGETSCLSCPSAFTTETIGSTDLSQCSEITTTPPAVTPKPDKPKANTITIVAVVLSALAFILSAIAIVCVWKKKIRSKTKRSNSVASLSNRHMIKIRPTTPFNTSFSRPATASNILVSLDGEKGSDELRNPCIDRNLKSQTRPSSSSPPTYTEYDSEEKRGNYIAEKSTSKLERLTVKVDILKIENY